MGCLPFVLQLPLFFALFSVLRAIANYKGGTPSYGLPQTMVQNAREAKIFGATLYDKFLFTGTIHVPLEAKIVILCFVVVSMVTTFLTIRQSQKRGMMPAATPDNPMASSQKYMTYIMPFFALTGLYWPFGLVLYWCTTNLWTLGQQFVLGLRYPYTPPAPVTDGAPASTGRAGAPATASALTGRPGRGGATGRAQRPDSKAGDGKSANGKVTAAGRKATVSGRAASNGATAGDTGSTGTSGATGGVLRRLSRGRSEPEDQPAEPEVKLVRHQTQRQTRSKRSGKR
jgi:YidC/Oxa1 family membrane protein insertase